MDQRKQSKDLYRPILKEGTHLAPSKGTKDTYRGSQLDDKTNKVDGQAEFAKVDQSEYESDVTFIYLNPTQVAELSPEDQIIAQFIGEVIIAGTTLVFNEIIAPQIKIFWQEKVIPSVREKWNNFNFKKKPKKAKKHSSVQNTELAFNSETISVMFSHKLDEAHEKYVRNLTNEEAQHELLDIFILSAVLIVKIRNLSSAHIIHDSRAPEEYIDGQELVQKLSAPEYIACINQILMRNPLLFEEKSVTLSEILGRNIALDYQYIPIDSNQFREKLMGL